MAFIVRFKLTTATVQGLLALFDLILPNCLPSTNYLLEKIFGVNGNGQVDIHYYCTNTDCCNYFGASIPAKCDKCALVYDGEKRSHIDSFMMI